MIRVQVCTVLVCNGCDATFHNGEFEPHRPDSEVGAAELREEAGDVDEGWWHADGVTDWCPKCRFEIHEHTPLAGECTRCGYDVSDEVEL